MHKLSIAFTAATTLIAGVSLFGGNTQAAIVLGPNGILDAANTLNVVEKVQVFYWHGRQYCWYDDGWQGLGGIGAVIAGALALDGEVDMAGRAGEAGIAAASVAKYGVTIVHGR